MKEQGAILLPNEPGVDWQRASDFPAREVLGSFRQLQQRVLHVELENLELRRQVLGAAPSREDVSRIYDSVSIAYLETNETTTIHQLNKLAAELLDQPAQQLVGKRLTDFLTESDGQRLMEYLKHCGSGNETDFNGEFQLRTVKQKQVDVQVACLPRANEPNTYSIGLANVTKMAGTEQKILRLAAFPTCNPNPVLEFDSDGTLIWFNDAALDLTKYLGLGSPIQIAPAHAKEIARECFKTRENRIREETVIGDRHLYWSFFPIETSHVVHCYGTDLTERLQFESQLEHARKLETVGQLASNVAHDFNNVLGIIQGYTCLLLAQSALPAETNEALRQISTAAERATFLTRQLMTFSRKQAFHPKPFDINELLNRVGPTMRGILSQNIHQELKLAPNLPALQGDPAMIEQVIINIAMNARDAMPRGGRFAVATSLTEVAAQPARRNPDAVPGKYICLTVTDTGQGMDRDTVSKIFEPFFTTKENGLGLGLSSAYGIVRQHHGWIEVESKVGGGTTFKIYLPVSLAAESSGKRQLPGAPKSTAGAETILVVEDEPALRELVSRQLRRQGYQIIQANSGKEALGLWAQHGQDVALLFTDMVMPDGMTGSELAETLQAQKPDLKVVYTSGYSQEVLQQDFALRGEVHFLQKPYHQDALIKTIRAALDAKAPVKD
jgi:two-component system cell cycle sensor histidine kinase/response regulator CckA